MGGFLGALLVYLIYLKQFDAYDGGQREMVGSTGTADIFLLCLLMLYLIGVYSIDQIIGTAILMIFIMSVRNKFKQMMSKVIQPFAFALIVTGIICAFSINAGAAINPARDLGPRLFGAIIYGWNNVFTVHDYFFWVPIVGPILGATIGVWIYQGFNFIVKQYGHLFDIDVSTVEIEQIHSCKF
ncbi:hypothetical protein I4U23_031435 [Adineta vaga]|nr:hypothetical protein I4U23_031435 [Adineta vaga]